MFAASKSAQATGSAPPPTPTTDPQFPYVTALLTGDGTNGAQNNTFIDSSPNNFTITRAGNTTQGSVSPYGGNWSNYFDGSGDYLSLPSNSAFAAGTGDFTFECWIYTSSVNDTPIYESRSTSSNTDGFTITALSSTVIRVYTSSVLVSATVSNYLNTWTHIAFTRQGNTNRLFVNGALGATSTASDNFSNPQAFIAGGRYLNNSISAYFTGHISNLRLVKGTALYTSSFTPPTSPLTAITNTQLLTCQSNRFIDNSTNNFAITVNGNTSIQVFSPFEPVAPYSTSTNGGSIYLDGSGDYLLTPANSAITAFGTGDFTIETWVYTTAFPHAVGMYLFDTRTSGNPNNWALYLASGDSLVFLYNGAYVTSYAGTFYQNRWYHIVYSRSGTSGKLFVNGVVVASPTDTNNYYQTTVCTVGARYTQDYVLQGYMSNARIVKGTAVYTSAFVPPSAPVTAITNTSLLLNGTNGGIFDNAIKNNLETVGNAQISTTQSKFGGSSMYFDGTGDYLYIPSTQFQNFAFGTGDFTIECWLYQVSFSGDTVWMASYFTWSSSVNFYCATRAGTPNILLFRAGDSLPIVINGNTGITANTWTHVAITRASGVTRMFVGGVLQTNTHTGSVNISATVQPVGIGAANNGTEPINGYIDDLRITKGYARYVANFTPPTQAFPTY